MISIAILLSGVANAANYSVRNLTDTYVGAGGTPFGGAPAICSAVAEPTSCSYDTFTNTYTCDSLREAVAHSNCYSAGPDVIRLDSYVYSVSRTLTSNWDDTGMTGDLDVWGALTVVGNGDLNTFIAGAYAGHPFSDRIFEVHTVTSVLALEDLQVRNGAVREPPSGSAGFTFSQETGGGVIRSEGRLELDRVIVYNGLAKNSISDEGGGCIYIAASGQGLVRDSQIDTCDMVESDGGAIHGAGDLEIINTLVSTGTTSRNGGGVAANANFTLSGSDIGGSDAVHQGGGLYLRTQTLHTVAISNSSFTENSQSGYSSSPTNPDYAYYGGAAVSADGVTVADFQNVTFGHNIATQRAGTVYVRAGAGSGSPALTFDHLTESLNSASFGQPGMQCNVGTCVLSESIVTDDGCGPGTSIVSGSSNLADTSPSCTSIGFSSGNAQLKGSTDNTVGNSSNWYIILYPSLSAAVDGSTVCPVDDQGGYTRSTATCELGSYEVP